MAKTRVVLSQIAPKLGQLHENLARHKQIIQEQRENKADLVLFPELSLTGYQLKDLVSEVGLTLPELTHLFSGMGPGRPLEFAVGWLERSAGFHYYNAYAYFKLNEKGQITCLHNHRKRNLPTYGMFEEERYFTRGRTLRSFDSPCLDRAGLLVCEDLWHPANPLILSLDGPELEGAKALIVGVNSPARGVEAGRTKPANAENWDLLARHAALTCNAFVFVTQRAGVEDGFVFVGGSAIFGPGGNEIVKAPLFEEAILVQDIQLAATIRERKERAPSGALEDLDLMKRELLRIERSHLLGDAE